MRQRLLTAFIALTLALGVAACTAKAPATPTTDSDFGRLELAYARIRHDKGGGSTLTFTIRNGYSDQVTGVRVLYRVLATPDKDGTEIARAQKEFDVKVGAGDTASLELPVPKNTGAGTFVQAYAVQRGDEKLPLPPKWQAETK